MNRKLWFSIFVLISFLWIFSAGESSASNETVLGDTPPDSADYYPGVIIVKLKAGRTLDDLQGLNAKHNVRSTNKLYKKPADRKQKLAELEGKLAKETTVEGKNRRHKQIDAMKKLIAQLEKRQQMAPKGITEPNLDNIYYLEVDPKADIHSLVAEYKLHPALEYAEPKYIAHPNLTPNDPYWNSDPDNKGYNFLWGLEKIMAPSAWSLLTNPDQSDVVVTNIEGIEITHPDFGLEDLNQNGKLDPGEDKNGNGILDTGNIWVNDIEMNGLPGVDDDGNGYVDDFYGVYFTGGSGQYTTQIQSSYHGTHTAGTMAAVGDNGIGVAGVTWGSKIMSAGPTGETEGILYAADNGADVINCSWTTGLNSQATLDALNYAHAKGCVVVASAGNNNGEATTGSPGNMENAITIAAADYQDIKAGFSNYGVKIDVTAPGVGVGSTYLNGTYLRLSGTSMSGPHVSGLAALIIQRNRELNASNPIAYPLLTNEQIRQVIKKTADDVLDNRGDGEILPGFDIYSGYGRINAFNALQFIGTTTSPCEANLLGPESNTGIFNDSYWNYTGAAGGYHPLNTALTAVSGVIDIKGVVNCGVNPRSYRVEYGAGQNPQTWTVIKDWTSDPVVNNILVSGFNTDNLPNGAYTIRLTVDSQTAGSYEDRMKLDVTRAFITNLPHKDGYFWTSDVLLFEPIDITGFARGTGFSSYHLEYETPLNSGVWVPASQDITSPVSGGYLFRNFDNALLPGGTVNVRLVVEDSSAGTSTDQLVFENDNTNFPSHTGFPVSTLYPHGYASPVSADINNDGKKEIIIGAYYASNYDGALYAFTSDGAEIFRVTTPGVVQGAPAVGILNSDPEPKIVIKTVTLDATATQGWHTIEVYNSDGSKFEDWPTLTYPISGYGYSKEIDAAPSPVLYDMDGDGKMEIIFGTSSGTGGAVYVYRSNGTPLPGWENGKTSDISAPVRINPVVGDINNDGSPEIVARDDNNNIYVWDASGNLLWTRAETGVSFDTAQIALADLDNDGYLEIVSSTQNPAGISIWKYNGYPFLSTTPLPELKIPSHFSIGDVDGDGYPEIVVPGVGITGNPIYCIRANGIALTDTWPVQADHPVPDGYPLIADIDNDGIKEILIAYFEGYVNEIVAYHPDGSKVVGDNWPIHKEGEGRSSMILDDLDADGKTELVFRGRQGKLRVWDLPFNYVPAAMDWPMFQHDVQHTGQYAFCPSCPVLAKRTLTVAKIGDGTVVSSPSGIDCGATCSAEYDNRTSVTLTATANVSGNYPGWSGCDTVNGLTCTVTMYKSRAVTVKFDSPADLSISMTGSPDTVPIGGTVTYTIAITNNGPGDATNVTATGSLPACTTPSLASGATFTCTRTAIPYNVTTLSKDMSVSGAVYDPNTANNTAVATTTVQGPDLVITSVSVSPQSWIGGTIFVSYTECNQGTVGTGVGTGAGKIIDRLCLSKDTTITLSDNCILYLYNDPLAAGACLTVTNQKISLHSGIAPGVYYIGAIADSENYIQETIETNNARAGNTVTLSATDPCADAATRCNDNNVCTDDTCNSATGACVFTNNTAPCDDGNACTLNDTCSGGVCVPGTAKVCDDSNVCTTDTCDPATGCVNNIVPGCGNSTGNNFTMSQPDGVVISGANDVIFNWDGTLKTAVAVSDQISNATLTSSCPFWGVPWSAHDVAIYGPGIYTVYTGCPAGSPGCGIVDDAHPSITFTVGPNEVGVHLLFNWNNSYDVDVVNVWSKNDVFGPSPMWTGSCGANPANKVWDGMSKDWDGDGVNGYPFVDGMLQGLIVNFNVMGLPPGPCADAATRCNDNDLCTTDTCDRETGSCINTPVSIDDGEPCTIDTCDPITGIAHTQIVCNDNNVCTTDTCNPVTGVCVFTNNTAPCDDGNACTLNDTCSGGVCVPGTAKVCNDNNVCTTDTCNTTTGACVFTNNTAPCDDGNACTLNDICSGGVCVPGTAKVCNDNNVCTTDTCNPTTGACVFTNNTAPCDDGNACTLNDTCSGGVCVPGAAKVCNDNNVCTTDTCNTTTGACVNTAITCPANQSCNPAIGACDWCYPNVTIVGGGGTTTVDKQIQTKYSVQGTGCIRAYTTSSVTVRTGTTLTYDCTVGTSRPTSGTLNGSAINVTTCTGVANPMTTNTLYLTNGSGSSHDTDTMTIN